MYVHMHRGGANLAYHLARSVAHASATVSRMHELRVVKSPSV